MSYKALYRKYRPSTFDEVKGQDHIVKTLKNIIINHKISHAYLFSGPRGVGKTSVAKIFANVLNCGHADPIYNICSSCQSKAHQNVDIIEMDAASNNGVNEIRDLKDKIEHSPVNSKYKIYIVDEVHMLSKGAFNALLKTLEEPPAHAIFILATTDPQKIPLTILSRVQRYNFRKIANQDLNAQIKNVLNQENIEYEDATIDYIVRLANGGLRDALSIADQAAAYGEGKIKLEDVMYAFGITSNQNLIKLINHLYNGEIKEALALFQELRDAGIDPNNLIQSINGVFKDVLIYQKTFDYSLLDLLNTDEIEQVKIDSDYAFSSSQQLYELMKNLAYSEDKFSLIELYLIKLSKNTKKYVKDEVLNQTINEVIHESIENKISNKQVETTSVEEEMRDPKDKKVNQALEQSQEIIISNLDDNQSFAEIENDLLINSSINTQENQIVSTQEVFIGDLNDNENVPAFDENNFKYDLIDQYDEDFYVSLLLNSDANEFEKYVATIDFTLSSLSSENPYINYLEVLKNVKIATANKNYILFRIKDDAIGNYLMKYRNRQSIQDFYKTYLGGYKHIFVINSEKYKNVRNKAKAYVENYISNNSNFTLPTLELGEVEIDKNTKTLTESFFDDLMNI